MRPVSSGSDGLQNATLLIVSIAGLLAFFLPFAISALPNAASQVSPRTIEASLLLALIVGGSLIITVAELVRAPGAGNQARSVALLGALVAIDATLRLVPSFLGASPIFALIVLVGYVFGPRFGFVMGTLTLLLSAVITAGVGPWLPFQMLCTGWIGVAAGWLPNSKSIGVELATAAAFGAAAGFAYGALMNLYSWPFAAPGVTSRYRTLLVTGAVGGRKHRALRGVLYGNVARSRCDAGGSHSPPDSGGWCASDSVTAAVSIPRGVGHIADWVARLDISAAL